MTVNLTVQKGVATPYPKTDPKPQNPQRLDGLISYLQSADFYQSGKTSSQNPSKDFHRHVLIAATTVPILLTGGYLGAIRGFERKFFRDSAQKTKKNFKPIIESLQGKINPVIIKTKDNLALKCWDINPNADKYILFCHGNGQNVSNCQELYSSLIEKGYGVLALEYRGYAQNLGSISEKGAYKDADAALKYLKDKGVEEKRIGVLGYSLGGAVATDLSSRHNFAFTILMSTFNNAKELSKNGANYLNLKLPRIIKRAIDKFPIRLIPLRNSYRSDLKINKIRSPIVFIHSQDDKDVPISLAQKLSSNAKSASAVNFMTLNSGNHLLDIEKIQAVCEALEKFSL